MLNKQQSHELLHQPPESELTTAGRHLEFLLSREAPMDPEMLARIDQARTQRSTGISHDRDTAMKILLCAHPV